MTAEKIGVTVGEGRTTIPVRNLWLLYLWCTSFYAHLPSPERVSAEQNVDHLQALAAKVLCEEVETRLQRAVTLQHVERHEAVGAVRGRIDHLTTSRGGHLQRGRVICRFEDLSPDTPRNRYVLAALDIAGRHLRRDRPGLANQCSTAATRLERLGVRTGPPDPATPRTEVFGHFDGQDRLMVSAAQLVIDWALPSHSLGGLPVRRLDYSERGLRDLYERALRNFYRRNLPSCRVGARRLSWPIAREEGDPRMYFPSMRTDISIDRPDGSQLIIDTKFTSALEESHRGSRQSFKSAHLYQLYAYIRTQDGGSGGVRSVEGLLLYPRTSGTSDIDVTAIIQRHRMRVATVDLAAPADAIRSRLLNLVAAAQH